MGDNSNHSLMGLYFTDTRRLVLKSEKKVKVVYIQSNTKFLKIHPQNTKYIVMLIGQIRNNLL